MNKKSNSKPKDKNNKLIEDKTAIQEHLFKLIILISVFMIGLSLILISFISDIELNSENDKSKDLNDVTQDPSFSNFIKHSNCDILGLEQYNSSHCIINFN